MGDDAISYAELYGYAARVAEQVISQQLAGQRIGMPLPNSPEFLACFYGIVLAGAIAVPLPLDVPHEQLGDWADHLGLAQVWTQLPSYARNGYAAAALDHSGEGHSHLEQVDRLEHSGKFATLDPDGLFYMAVSSGSTGKPKGILRTHRSWVESFMQMKRAFAIGQSDRLLLPGPLCYSATLIAALQILHEGGEVHLHRRFRAEAVAEALANDDITACFMVPTMYAKLLELDDAGSSKPMTFVSAGAKLADETRAAWQLAFPHGRLYEYYGSAEVSFVTLMPPDRWADRKGSVGQPFCGVELSIRNDQGAPVEAGTVGDIYVKSAMVASGYGQKGSHSFPVPIDGAYPVGDIGYVDESGFLYLVGRKQELMVRGGINIYPIELEQALAQLPFVRQAAVFSVPDPIYGEKVVAAVQIIRDCLPDPLDWPEQVRDRLARSHWPDAYWPLDSLPLNSAGKVDKIALKQQLIELDAVQKT